MLLFDNLPDLHQKVTKLKCQNLDEIDRKLNFMLLFIIKLNFVFPSNVSIESDAMEEIKNCSVIVSI